MPAARARPIAATVRSVILWGLAILFLRLTWRKCVGQDAPRHTATEHGHPQLRRRQDWQSGRRAGTEVAHARRVTERAHGSSKLSRSCAFAQARRPGWRRTRPAAGRVRRQPEQATCLAEAGADVVCLQEIRATTLERGGARSGPRIRARRACAGLLGRKRPARRPLAVPTASRLKMSVLPGPRVPWPERVLAVRLAAPRLEIVNLHSPISPSPGLAKVRTHEAVHEYLARAADVPRCCGEEHPARASGNMTSTRTLPALVPGRVCSMWTARVGPSSPSSRHSASSGYSGQRSASSMYTRGACAQGRGEVAVQAGPPCRVPGVPSEFDHRGGSVGLSDQPR